MKQYLKVAAIVVVTVIAVNTIIKRVPGVGPAVGGLWGGL